MKNIAQTCIVRLYVGMIALVLMTSFPVASVADDDEGTYKPEGIGTPSGRVGGGSRGHISTPFIRH